MNLLDAIASYRDYRSEQGIDFEYPDGLAVDGGIYWYLPDPEPLIGSNGVIIRKEDGAVFVVGSQLSRELACWAFERGILDGEHDLIITSCSADIEAAIDILTKTPPSQRGKKLPEREGWHNRLSKLPVVVLSNASLYFYIVELFEAERKGIFTFETTPSIE
ncbi:MAG: hypothetical protein V4819_06860 [Verrucomicrobiota bacterium]